MYVATAPATVEVPVTSTPSQVNLMLAADRGSLAVKVTGPAYAALVAPLAGLIAGAAAKVGAVVSVATGVLVDVPPPPPPQAVSNRPIKANDKSACVYFMKVFLFELLSYRPNTFFTKLCVLARLSDLDLEFSPTVVPRVMHLPWYSPYSLDVTCVRST